MESQYRISGTCHDQNVKWACFSFEIVCVNKMDIAIHRNTGQICSAKSCEAFDKEGLLSIVIGGDCRGSAKWKADMQENEGSEVVTIDSA